MKISEAQVEAALKVAPKFWRQTEDRQKHMRKCLEAAAALSSPIEGMVLVPVEPTEAMIDAGVSEAHGKTWGDIVANCYRAMLSAGRTAIKEEQP